jgi:rod shape determining protein RodA
MIYASSHQEGEAFYSFQTIHGKQILWIALSFIIMILCYILPLPFWRNFSFLIYLIGVILLFSVLFIGTEIKGARSWFSLGSFTFQPGEFAKFSTLLAVSAYFGSSSFQIKNVRALLTGIVIIIVPFVLILLQPDAGSALVFLAFFIVLYRMGFSQIFYFIVFILIGLFVLTILYGRFSVLLFAVSLAHVILVYNTKKPIKTYLIILLLAIFSADFILSFYGLKDLVLILNGLLLLILLLMTFLGRKFNLSLLVFSSMLISVIYVFSVNLIFENYLEKHQQERINVWLRPDKCDPRGSLYNVIQSKVAIGSGGVSGKGFLNGTMTNLNYVPEQSTDFIFCTIGEEQGFVGVFALLVLYLFFILRILFISEKCRRDLTKIYGYGLASILFIHFFINVGMTMGIVPIIGIPLPFISYGGSSLIFFSVMFSVFLRYVADDS